jgi:flagellar basal body-associated protein FliL
MAETSSSQNQSSDAGAHAAAGGKGSLLGKLAVVLFLVAVIVAECGVAYFYLPASSATAASPPAPKPAEKTGEKDKESAPSEEAEAPSQAEVDMGEFSVTAFQPSSNSTLRIDFHLFGTVKAGEEKEFARLMEENKHRFREQVLMTVRSAEITDIADPGLGLIKRQLLDRTNRTLGKPLLRAVVISDFSFVEQ